MRWFKKGPAYGRIAHMESYLTGRYQGTPELLEQVLLPIKPRHMHDDFGKAKACSLMAIDHIMGYDTGVERDASRLERLRREARKLFYFDWRGTPVIAIAPLWRKMGYRVQGSLMLSFSRMKRELNHGRPFILNLAWGDYPAHTVTIVGYQRWRVKNREIPVLITADGWARDYRYIDFRALVTFGSGTLAHALYGRPN